MRERDTPGAVLTVQKRVSVPSDMSPITYAETRRRASTDNAAERTDSHNALRLVRMLCSEGEEMKECCKDNGGERAGTKRTELWFSEMRASVPSELAQITFYRARRDIRRRRYQY